MKKFSNDEISDEISDLKSHIQSGAPNNRRLKATQQRRAESSAPSSNGEALWV